jgi:hypothetical protein
MASAKTIVDWAFKHVELAEQAIDTAEMESRILDDENQKG